MTAFPVPATPTSRSKLRAACNKTGRLGSTALVTTLAIATAVAPAFSETITASRALNNGENLTSVTALNVTSTGALTFAGSSIVSTTPNTAANSGITAAVGPAGSIVNFSGSALTNNSSGLFYATNGAAITNLGSVNNSGRFEVFSGSSITVTGQLSNISGGTVGTVTGSTLNIASMNNATGANANFGGVLNVGTGSGTIINNGALGFIAGSNVTMGALTNSSSGTFNALSSATLSGAFTNNGTANLSGSAAQVSASQGSNSGTLTIHDGKLDVATAFDNSVSAGTINITGSGELEAASMSNAGTVNVGPQGTAALLDVDTINNSGTLVLRSTAGTVVDGSIVGSGGSSIQTVGTQTITGNVSGTNTFEMSTINASSADALTIGGTLNGTNTFNINIRPGEATPTDTISVTGGDAGATGTINFTNLAPGGLQNTIADILVGPGFDVADWTVGTGVSTTGTIVTSLEQNGTNVGYLSQINPAIGGIAGGLALSQSLINSVVNRPSSAFGGGLAVESGNNCGPGSWGRLAVGSATIDGSSNNGASNTASNNSIDYEGIQLGGDVGCYQGAYNGWDIAIGGTLGFNTGEIVTKVPTSKTVDTTSEFDQFYVGGYLLASNGPLRMDLQVRGDETDFVINNANLGLNDADYKTSSTTLSGSVSYAVPLNDNGLVAIPTGGLSLTRTKTDLITFEADPVANIPSSTLSQGSYTDKIAFVGSTLAKTSINADGVSATTSFVTATYYENFSDDLTANFRIGNTDQEIVTSSNRSYGELSAGLNYVRILDGGGASAAKQMNLAVRADARIGEDIDGYGLTANFRFQF